MSEIEGTPVVARDGATIIVGRAETVATPDIIENPDGLGGFVVVRDGYTVHQLAEARAGYPHHKFDDLASFAEYMSAHFDCEARDGEVDILVGEGSVTAHVRPEEVLPTTCCAIFANHPAWLAWTGILNQEMTQRQLQQFIRGWRKTMDNHEELMAVLAAMSVTGSSTMTSHIDETGASRLASSEGTQDVSVKIPSTLQVAIPCYEGITDQGGDEILYVLEILVRVDLNPVYFELSCPTIALKKREARRDVAAMLRRSLGEDFLVGLGEARHAVRSVSSNR